MDAECDDQFQEPDLSTPSVGLTFVGKSRPGGDERANSRYRAKCLISHRNVSSGASSGT